MNAPLVWEDLGRCEYARALVIQEERWAARQRGGADACLAVEHDPIVTFGRRATAADLRVPEGVLAERGIACAYSERGGRTTYHGPGQLVLYPVVGLAARGFGVAEFVWTLEQIMIAIAGAFGVRAARDARGRGVWGVRGKIGAVGIRVRDGISTHGLALNVAVDLAPYAWIVPCGMADGAVSSLVHEGAGDATVAAAARIAATMVARHLATEPGRVRPADARPAALPALAEETTP